MSSHASNKPVWLNQFQNPVPSVAQLRAGYAKPARELFDAARQLLQDLPRVSEDVVWHGVPWRWTMVYRAGDPSQGRGMQAPATRAFAYLIPDPTRLQVCVPLTRELLATMPLDRFKKGVRDTIVYARTIAGACWPTWEVTTPGTLEDVAELIGRKQRALGAGLAVHASA